MDGGKPKYGYSFCGWASYGTDKTSERLGSEGNDDRHDDYFGVDSFPARLSAILQGVRTLHFMSSRFILGLWV